MLGAPSPAKPIAIVEGASRRRDRELDPLGAGGGNEDDSIIAGITRDLPAPTLARYSQSYGGSGWLERLGSDGPESGFRQTVDTEEWEAERDKEKEREKEKERGKQREREKARVRAAAHKMSGLPPQPGTTVSIAPPTEPRRAEPQARIDGNTSVPVKQQTPAPAQQQATKQPPQMQHQQAPLAQQAQRTATKSPGQQAVTQPPKQPDLVRRGSVGALTGIKPKWEADSAVTRCRACLSPFSMFLRKHHCRMCGKIFCGWCTRYKDVYHNVSVRVCNSCYDINSLCDTLPTDALIRVFQYILAIDVNKMLALRSVCRRWNNVVSDVRLWPVVQAGYFKDVRSYISMYGRWHKGECDVQEYDLIGVSNWQCDSKSSLIVGINSATYPPSIVGQDLVDGRVLFTQACGGRVKTWNDKNDMLLCGHRIVMLLYTPGQSLLLLYDWTPPASQKRERGLKLQQSRVLYVESASNLVDFIYPWVVLADGDTLTIYHFDTCEVLHRYTPELPEDGVLEAVDYVMHSDIIMSTEAFVTSEQEELIYARIIDLKELEAGHKLELALDKNEMTNIIWDTDSRLCLVVQSQLVRMYCLDTGELLAQLEQPPGTFGDKARSRKLHFEGKHALITVRESDATATEDGTTSGTDSRESSIYGDGSYCTFRMYFLTYDVDAKTFAPPREFPPYEGTIHRVWLNVPLQLFVVFDMQDVYVYSLITGRDLYGMNEQEGALLTSFHADMKGIAVLQGRHVTYSRFTVLPQDASITSACVLQ